MQRDEIAAEGMLRASPTHLWFLRPLKGSKKVPNRIQVSKRVCVLVYAVLETLFEPTLHRVPLIDVKKQVYNLSMECTVCGGTLILILKYCEMKIF